MPIKTCITRTTICPVCERKFSGRELKSVKKLLDLHILKSHEGVKIEESTTMQFIHPVKTPGGMKRMSDTELKALYNQDYDPEKMDKLIQKMSDNEIVDMYQRLILS